LFIKNKFYFFLKFIHEELESKTDSVRHRRFQNADLQITFDDLWTQWKNNPGLICSLSLCVKNNINFIFFQVYNWTNDDVIHWIVNHVHLSIYVEYFRRNQIDGRMIPRLIFIFRVILSLLLLF
jgi:hypothetical protein